MKDGEDIKILKDLINRLRNRISLGVVNKWNPDETFAQAIENLINKYKELEEENRIQKGQLNSAFDRGFIHKDKVKEKIEELKNRIKELEGIECNSEAIEILEIRINDLQELLEE